MTHPEGVPSGSQIAAGLELERDQAGNGSGAVSIQGSLTPHSWRGSPKEVALSGKASA